MQPPGLGCTMCKYFQEDVVATERKEPSHLIYGKCRINPPTVVFFPSGKVDAKFPRVDSRDWCGKWEKKQ